MLLRHTFPVPSIGSRFDSRSGKLVRLKLGIGFGTGIFDWALRSQGLSQTAAAAAVDLSDFSHSQRNGRRERGSKRLRGKGGKRVPPLLSRSAVAVESFSHSENLLNPVIPLSYSFVRSRRHFKLSRQLNRSLEFHARSAALSFFLSLSLSLSGCGRVEGVECHRGEGKY